MRRVAGLLLFGSVGFALLMVVLRPSVIEKGTRGGRPGAPTLQSGLTREVICGNGLRATHVAKRLRPPEKAPGEPTEELSPNAIQLFNGYGTPESLYVTTDVVIHHVTRGVNAPPLNDDDGDGVPDYVEHVADAAHKAQTYFRAAGYVPIRADTGGPNALPDIYISRFTPGYFGAAIPASRTSEGAFVAIANWLDPSPSRSLGSVYGTVAHELFHLVQFSYFPPDMDGMLPGWIEEGTAGGIEGRANPDLDDVLWNIQTRDWLATPCQSITTSSYGSEILWNYVARTAPHLVPNLLRGLARRPGDAPLSVIRNACGWAGTKPFEDIFHDFAIDAYANRADELNPTGWLGGPRTRVTVSRLSVQYLRLPVPTQLGYRLTADLPSSAARTHASVVYRLQPSAGSWPRVIRLKPMASAPGSITWRLQPASTEQDLAVLLTSASLSRPTTYNLRLTKVERRH